MDNLLTSSLSGTAAALQAGDVSSVELVQRAIALHRDGNHAYKHWDPEQALQAAGLADQRLADGSAGPLCGIPVSVKDLYGVAGMPTFAGTARRLPDQWETDAWLVARLRAQGAVFMGKTHTVELAYGAVGTNPHWGTPRNPWDSGVHRVPGGSSCGAGVSLWEGSALLALGSDTGGSIRIPASMTGTVGQKLTHARWSVEGVVPLSTSLDSVGGLTRSAEDAAYFFGAVDPAWGDPVALLNDVAGSDGGAYRLAVPRCGIWDDCQSDIADVLHWTMDELDSTGWRRVSVDGGLLDEAGTLYMRGGIAGAECRAFLDGELPEWLEILHPTVGTRLATTPRMGSEKYRDSLEHRGRLMAGAEALFAGADFLVLPTAIITPPAVSAVDDLDLYVETNVAALRPTCPISLLGLCAITLPVGRDGAGMPVGLQLVARGGWDEALLGVALAMERSVGPASERLGRPGALSDMSAVTASRYSDA
jgi:aspartyl-tRNA(Asn)/glutamyl-tRNA(Gln) amidotransferase subunit A